MKKLLTCWKWRHRKHHKNHIKRIIILMADSLHVDQTGTGSIKAVDSKGNLVAVTFDAAPVWLSSNPAVATVNAGTDGTTVEIDPVAVGVTTISVSASISGKVFTASDDLTVVAGTVASISIVVTVNPA